MRVGGRHISKGADDDEVGVCQEPLGPEWEPRAHTGSADTPSALTGPRAGTVPWKSRGGQATVRAVALPSVWSPAGVSRTKPSGQLGATEPVGGVQAGQAPPGREWSPEKCGD